MIMQLTMDNHGGRAVSITENWWKLAARVLTSDTVPATECSPGWIIFRYLSLSFTLFTKFARVLDAPKPKILDREYLKY